MARIGANNEESDKCFCCCFPKRVSKEGAAVQEKQTSTANEIPTEAQNVSFRGELPNNLTLGNVICITGFVLPNCMRFAVNLTYQKGSNVDIAFHLNPRLDRKYVVRNALLNGYWGQEETASIVKFNMLRNKKFEIWIFVADEEFLVAINGSHFCRFAFRVPLNLCTGINVEGAVDVYDVEYKTWNVYPENGRSVERLNITAEEEPGQAAGELGIPYTGHLPKGFQDGWQLEIQGRVKLLPHSFYVNLQEGSQMWPHPIIPLHLNPRFIGAGGDNLFVRNSWFDGHWGSEERTSGFQFSPGAPFNLTIRRSCDHFSVWVDGQLTGEFKFRGAVDKIDTVYIQGDIILNKIVMHEKLIDMRKNP